jgi:hypothetical protein
MLLSSFPSVSSLCVFCVAAEMLAILRIDGFAHSFVSPKKKRKKEQKIFMFEKIDSLFVVVVAINRTSASVISGVLIFYLVKIQSWVCVF